MLTTQTHVLVVADYVDTTMTTLTGNYECPSLTLEEQSGKIKNLQHVIKYTLAKLFTFENREPKANSKCPHSQTNFKI